ncbi:DUF2231 domain-containing protein [Caldimonas mangrovi]
MATRERLTDRPPEEGTPAPRQAAPIRSRAAIAGHPLHPMMIHFPVAALLGLVAVDVAYLMSRDPFWARAGLWLAGVGAAGGWIASLAGLVDLVTVAPVRRLVTGWCHAVIAVMMLSLASMNWLLRFGDDQALVIPWGLYVSLLTAAMIALAAYLGGRLVYEHAVGVDTEE